MIQSACILVAMATGEGGGGAGGATALTKALIC